VTPRFESLARAARWSSVVAVLAACGDQTTQTPLPVSAGVPAAIAGMGGAGRDAQPPAAISGRAAPPLAGTPAAGSFAAGRSATGAAGMQADAGGMSAAGASGSVAGSPDTLPAGDAIQALKAYLAIAHAQRPELAAQTFAKQPLSRSDAEQARMLLWEDFAARVRETRAGEMGATESRAASVQVDGKTLRYYMAERGDAAKTGRSLFISMHGGGNAPAATNDSQWTNQIRLVDQYQPEDAIWVAPRAPSNEWNMWFTPDVDALFERLITNFIVFEGVDPNKVYINGYSAGGDGVYQLGPRMADHWAGAGMSAGHPNASSPLSLYNVAFAIHVGGNDTAYDRNLKAAEWGMQLEQLRAAHPDVYVHQWQVHAGKPHWMDLADQVSIPFLQKHTRNPVPSKVVWEQVERPHTRSYWLAVDAAHAKKDTLIRASYTKGAIEITEVREVPRLTVRVSDSMMDLDQPVRISRSGAELFSGMISRTIEVVARTLRERGDPALVFDGETAVDL
jgi:poly(3-hydroxybutyrate) depolymerase